MTTPSPEIQAAVDSLLGTAKTVRDAASQMLAALALAQKSGAEIRQSDIDTIRNRFGDAIPKAIERRAGALLPPANGVLNINLDDAAVT